MLDESEFLADFGIRGLSKSYEKNPFQIFLQGATHTVDYVPGAGKGNRSVFGDNDKFQKDPHFKDHISFMNTFMVITAVGWVRPTRPVGLR